MLITRYLFKNLLGVTVFVTTILTLLIMLTQSLRFLELIVETGAPASSFFQLILLAIPRFLEVILPLSVVISILFIYNKMTMDNELIVLRAAGFNQRALMMPALILSGLCCGLLLVLTLWGTPLSHGKMEQLRDVIKTEYASLLLREGVFNNLGEGLIVYVDNRNSDGTLDGLVIHDTRDTDKPPVTFIAKKGEIISQRKEDTASIVIYDGRRQQLDPRTNSLNTLLFSEYTLQAKNLKNDTRLIWKEPDERTITELLSPNLKDRRDIKYSAQFKAEIHKRILTPFTVFSFALVGLSALLLGSFNRRGQSRRIVVAMTCVILLQSGYLSLGNAIEKNLSIVWAYYPAVISPALIAIFLVTPLGEKIRRRFTRDKEVKQ